MSGFLVREQEEVEMLIAIISFLVLRVFITLPICEWAVVNVSGIRYLLALLMFCGIGMLFVRHPYFRFIGTAVLVGSILMYVGTSTVLPYYEMLATVLAAVLAVAIVVVAKRWMIPAVRRANFGAGMKIILHLV